LTSIRHARNSGGTFPSARNPSMDRTSALALRALGHSLGQSPRFAPSREQVRECLALAARLLRAEGWAAPALYPPYERRPGLSLREALARYDGHRSAHVHAERLLVALVEAPFLAAWEQSATRGKALALLRRAERLLRPPLRRGPHVTAGPVAAGSVRFAREELAAHRLRLCRPPCPKQLSLWEEVE
jgi:hypothetical protein